MNRTDTRRDWPATVTIAIAVLLLLFSALVQPVRGVLVVASVCSALGIALAVRACKRSDSHFGFASRGVIVLGILTAVYSIPLVLVRFQPYSMPPHPLGEEIGFNTYATSIDPDLGHLHYRTTEVVNLDRNAEVAQVIFSRPRDRDSVIAFPNFTVEYASGCEGRGGEPVSHSDQSVEFLISPVQPAEKFAVTLDTPPRWPGEPFTGQVVSIWIAYYDRPPWWKYRRWAFKQCP